MCIFNTAVCGGFHENQYGLLWKYKSWKQLQNFSFRLNMDFIKLSKQPILSIDGFPQHFFYYIVIHTYASLWTLLWILDWRLHAVLRKYHIQIKLQDMRCSKHLRHRIRWQCFRCWLWQQTFTSLAKYVWPKNSWAELKQ